MTEQSMSGSGRKRTVNFIVSDRFQRPLLGKADVQNLIDEESARTSASRPIAATGLVR